MKKAILIFVFAIAIISGLALGKFASAAARDWGTSGAVREYLRSHEVRKLQLGSGTVDLTGWLNSDIEPHKGQIYLDITKAFPFPDDSLQYIFGEHVIEHVTYQDGLFALRECHRVLATGGRLRLATPDLKRIVAILEHPPDGYVPAKFAFHIWDRLPSVVEPVWIINQEMTNFGHRFVYDEAALTDSLHRAGFLITKRVPPGESDDPNLRGIDFRHKIPTGPVMNDYESMVLEATK